MTSIVRPTGIRETALALALLAAFAPAHADDESVMEASVAAGLGTASGDSADRSLFGQYNGLRRRSVYGLLDGDYYRRNDDEGTMTRLQAFDLLGETRTVSFVWKRQGRWKLGLDYSDLVRHEPYIVNTGMLGAGTTTPRVVHLPGGPGTGSDLELKTKRSRLGLSYATWLAPSLELQTKVTTENKDGSRLFGAGMGCPSFVAPGCGFTTNISAGWGVLFLPEPVESNHTQVELRLSYAADKLRLSGGYYGSFYSNSAGSLDPDVPGSLNNPLGVLLPLSPGLQPILGQRIALWPDNQAHHFDLAGVYVFTPSTRANFKLGYSRATQNQSFAGAGLSGAPAGVADLGAEVNTTLAHVRVTSRPIRKLSLSAEMRYTDRDDDTPLDEYNLIRSTTFTNRQLSRTKLRGKLQASYQFSSDYRGTLGAEYESIDRDAFTITSAVSGISALRQKTDEVSYRAELRRRMSDDFSGAISWVTSRRDGSNWQRVNSGLGVTEITDPAIDLVTGSVFMPTVADRERDKIRLVANWQVDRDLSLQFSAEDGRDRFTTLRNLGLKNTRMATYTVDWDYRITRRWNFSGYVSHGLQKLNQARQAGYVMAYDNSSMDIGLGLTGNPTGDLEVGGSLSFIYDTSRDAQTLEASGNANSAALLAASGGLPDIVFRRMQLSLFGSYELSDESSVRVDLVHQRARLNDWAFGYDGVPFVHGDNTTVSQQPRQSVTFFGIRYIHRFE
ncbi:MAG: MtrB/PioB family decaheme-associated outer membrane protein [Burkholderiales bacterium]|nr:MAG: MtrB/PioB family decaheme-associated outer membrane protein [Burkholderiales bacterium]